MLVLLVLERGTLHCAAACAQTSYYKHTCCDTQAVPSSTWPSLPTLVILFFLWEKNAWIVSASVTLVKRKLMKSLASSLVLAFGDSGVYGVLLEVQTHCDTISHLPPFPFRAEWVGKWRKTHNP